ncbi:PP2C family protein-serine/threonine phosphatase [Microtetraspora niveoalba]|uniref:PP2C family protein-serine/threonine phosphatase n=1 Tax=Microtetraspora niveoalba TaxID=46175 RepID=UPI000B2669F3|nr:PP2C family protein-serine/threonine phosphatase [Microtetraspora niveoalba]
MRSDDERMLGGLVHASHLVSLENVPALVAEHAALWGLSETTIYIADLQQLSLVPLPGQRSESGEPPAPIRIDATLAGRAYRNVEIVRVGAATHPSAGEAAEPPVEEGPLRLWVPLLDGTERLGVIAVTVAEPTPATGWRIRYLASLLAFILESKRAVSDSYAVLERTRPMNLSAEVLWNLMPARTFANERVVVGAALEPAYEMGGDTFDYALNGDIMHLAIFDAMGHDTAAGLTATIAIGAYRYSRRQGVDPVAASEAIDAAIGEQFAGTRFATGVLAALNTATGRLVWVNRGHHPPLVIRDKRTTISLDGTPSPPMGLGLSVPASLAEYHLEPGDRLLLYTDGIIEARSPEGEPFGLRRFIDFVVRQEAGGLTTPETLRRLIQSILAHQEGRLQDDATVVLLEWRTQTQPRLML